MGGETVELYKRENYLKKLRGFYKDPDIFCYEVANFV